MDYLPLACFGVALNMYEGRWRLDGVPWEDATTTLYWLPLGEHLIEFDNVAGYLTPAPQTVFLGSGYNDPLPARYVWIY